ncbi:MAG: GH1 family beta-glucosidase [Lachnospiraceae bacterium]|nr:GH1 family beta-glucosidase [Lachnospiraceae bacterium]
MGFKKEMVWGVATSAYQIEGAAYEDGKGVSIWDAYCKEGHIYEQQTGDVACDHYHHMKKDVKLMAELGINAYRCSISWPRIFPNGIGKINEKGIQFYSDLVDELLTYEITPYVTLFHWDYPNALEMQGGWMNEESSKWFEEYAITVAKALGDRVKHFITFNEPQIFTWLGYDKGIHAPGVKYHKTRILQMTRNIALAHGKAVTAIRKVVEGAIIGYAPTCGMAYYPIEETKECIEVARKMNSDIDRETWLYSAPFWNELMIHGRFHKKCYEFFEKELLEITDNEKEIISQPIDFCGMNIYQGTAVGIDKQGNSKILPKPIGHPKTGMGWQITPPCIQWAPRFFFETYQLPVLITENGMSAHDAVSLDGKVHDPNRIDYLQRHLLELEKAVKAGVDVMGYFQWSFMDNFEWEKGYNDRFGIVYVDYQTQQRIPKDSYYWYQEMIKTYRQTN